METELDGRCLDVAEFGIAVFGEGGEEDVGSGLVPVRPAGGLDLRRVLLLTPYVSPARAGFLEVGGKFETVLVTLVQNMRYLGKETRHRSAIDASSMR